MAHFEIIFCICFSFLFLSLQPSKGVKICLVSCDNSQWIRFPFSLDTQNDRCGYPGFQLSCQNQSQTTITLPFAGKFMVGRIDYWSQNIWISDPDNCTPKRLLKGFNLSHTPFEPLNPQNVVFLNCSSVSQLPEGTYIPCLSDENFSVVAIPTDRLNLYAGILSSCLEIVTVSLPTSNSDINNGLRLTWSKPDCLYCEQNGGTCMFNSDTGLDLRCAGDLGSGSGNGLPESAKLGLTFGLGIPLLTIMGIVFYLRRKANNFNNQQLPTLQISVQITPRRLAAEQKGLDGSTIEAYPTSLVGESGELPRPSDNTCSICLCEYQAKETLRTIPDCKHYFHVSCIDEWLILNATCPVCRNTTTESSVPIALS